MRLRINRGVTIPTKPRAVNPVTVPLSYIQRAQTNWCWTAAAEMVFNYYGRNSAGQCDVANFQLGRNDCCGSSAVPNSACDKTCVAQAVSKIFSNWQIQSQQIKGSVSFSTLQAEINAQRPVEVGFVWSSGNKGHLAIVYGWEQNNSGSIVLVHDPDPNRKTVVISYSDLLTAYGLGNWKFTWTGLK